jgi:hypothetical protein
MHQHICASPDEYPPHAAIARGSRRIAGAADVYLREDRQRNQFDYAGYFS